MKNFLKPNKPKIILSIIAIGIMIFSFSALAMWEVPGIPDGIVDKDLDQVILDITNWLLGFAGILALLFIIWGGIQYTTAAGNDDQMENAKKTVKWGIIGLVITGLSFAIISVVVGVWMGGGSSSASSCSLGKDNLDTEIECSAAGCDWITNTKGCCDWGLTDCGYVGSGYIPKDYDCSVIVDAFGVWYSSTEWCNSSFCNTDSCCCE